MEALPIQITMKQMLYLQKMYPDDISLREKEGMCAVLLLERCEKKGVDMRSDATYIYFQGDYKFVLSAR